MEKIEHKCCASVFGKWSSHNCENKAKMEHEGKWYCGIHDPVRKAEKDRAWREKFDREWGESQEKYRKEAQREKFLLKCEEAIVSISQGHNDPRTLALEVLSEQF